MGAHVWTPDVIVRDVLPAGRLMGWSDDWFAGMPVLQFYFPLPTYLILALTVVLPYGIAFKLVTIAGSLLLPWTIRRMLQRTSQPEPMPTIAGLSMYVFIFGRYYDWTGYGGTIFSTMSGEFSFSLSVAFAAAFIGKFTYLVRSGKGRWSTGLVLAATGLSHILPTIWALAAAALVLAISLQADHWRRQLRDSVLVGLTGFGFAAFWLVPFAANLAYTNDMGWERKRDFLNSLLPFTARSPVPDSALIAVATAFALVALVLALGSLAQACKPRTGWTLNHLLLFALVVIPVVRAASVWRGAAITAVFLVVVVTAGLCSFRKRTFDWLGVFLTLLTSSCAIVFVQLPQFRLWNARVLPFWFLSLLLLASLGAVRSVQLASCLVQWIARGHARVVRGSAQFGIATTAGAVFVTVGLPLGMVPAAAPIPKYRDGMVGVQRAGSTNNASGALTWTTHNFKGYEGASGWGEYDGLMKSAQRVGRQRGCGRAMWEYDEATINRYGTTLALTLLPFWTKGCIGSMEGVYFESSPTAPAHWINAALISAPKTEATADQPALSGPSNPQRNLLYPSFDLERGIANLRSLGVRYYMAFSPTAVAAANRSTQLVAVDQSPSVDPISKHKRVVWHFYEIRDHALVAPISEQPVVLRGVGPGMTEGWLDVSMAVYGAPPHTYPLTITAAGPPLWERTDVTIVKRPGDRTFGTGVHLTRPAARSQLSVGRRCLQAQLSEERTDEPSEPVGAAAAPPSSREIAAAASPRRTRTQICPDLDSEQLRTPPDQPTLPTTTISNVKMSAGKISFNVSRTDVPVVVRTSYFPNWRVRGGKGPYRTLPNQMTVIPTSTAVSLVFDMRAFDYLGYAVSTGTLTSALLWRVRRRK